MSVSLKANTLRLPCDQSRSTQDSVGDLLRGEGHTNWTIWRASRTLLQGAIFVGGSSTPENLVTEFGGVQAVVMQMREGGPTGALLFPEKTRTLAQLNTTLTFQQWFDNEPDAYHFQFELTSDDLNVGAMPIVYLVIGVLTDEGPFVIAQNPSISIKESGLFGTSDVTIPAPPAAVYTQAQVDAKIAALAIAYRPDITSAAGSTSTALRMLASTTLATYSVRDIRETGLGITRWVLEPDGDPIADAREVVPADHHATANPRTWRQRG